MLKKILLISILFSTLLNAKMYSDIKYSTLDYKDKDINKNFKLNGYKLSIGYMSENFSFADVGVESSIATDRGTKIPSITLEDETVITDAHVDIDFLYAVHLKITRPIVDILYGNLYFGLDYAKISSSAIGNNNSSRWEGSYSYGIGLEYWIPLGVSIQLNYMSYFNNLDAMEFGFGLKF